MKTRICTTIGIVAMMVLLLAGCGGNDAKANTTEDIAKTSDAIELEVLVAEGTKCVLAEDITAGTYEAVAESDSSMFEIKGCTIDVTDEGMTAVITVDGTGYSYICMNTPEDTVASDGSDYVEMTDNGDGTASYEVNIEALDKELDVSTYSVKKERWYGHKMVVRAGNLPLDAFRKVPFDTVASLGLADGEYSMELEMLGGSGRASVESPAKVVIKDGKATATITWSSNHYDYMIVKGEKYLPVNTSGNSSFEIPIEAFGYEIPAIGDTTAMSKPHEIAYRFIFRPEGA